jgi:hypothetical protein
MAILPIDIQTILGQMNTAGKAQHNIEQNPLNQQINQGNAIHDQSLRKDKQVVNLEETDSQDKQINPDSKNPQEFHQEKQNQESEEEKAKAKELYRDPEKGNLIDVKK